MPWQQHADGWTFEDVKIAVYWSQFWRPHAA